MTVPVIARILSDPALLNELAGADSEVVGREIYRRFHLAMTFDDEVRDDDTGLLVAVRTALGGRTHLAGGNWAYQSALSDGRLIVRRDDGLQVAVEFGDIERMAAGRITVRLPSLEPGVMNGWVWFHSSIRPEHAAELSARIYLCLDGEGRASGWADLVAGLDDQAYVFSSKIIRRKKERARPDGVVVYCRTGDVPVFLESIGKLIPPGQLGTATAGFAVGVSPGASVSVPQEGEDRHASLGMERSRNIARRLVAGDPAESAVVEVARVLEEQSAQVAALLGEAV
ncbi:T3SS effector HopA1 family protein [Streptomyces sp. NBC_00212]|uniref:T3SS effector HopA1 family protein n=1 Tax=Streptomyces sp. NBC_00212 TaxID=2975684 RepID=UPI002F90CF52